MLSTVFCVADSIAVVLQVPRIDKYNANYDEDIRFTRVTGHFDCRAEQGDYAFCVNNRRPVA